MQLRSFFATSAIALALSASSTLPAFAHAMVLDTAPSDGKKVDSVDHVSVTANEELLDIGKNSKGFVLAVRDEAGLYYGDGCVTIDRDTASMPVTLGNAGEYRVVYRIVSNDGHPIEGSYSFRFGGDASGLVGDAFAERPQCGVSQTPVALDDDSTSNPDDEAGETPTDAPTLIAEPTIEPASPNDMGIIPWLAASTIPVIGVAIWLLVRSLGKRDSEDHLN